MNRRWLKIVAIVLVVTAVGAYWFLRDTREIRVLVFSKTLNFRHESIEDGIRAIQAMGKDHGFTVDTTENSAVFKEKQLNQYNVVVFLNTTGNVLNDAQQLELNRWVQAGGGFVGIHAAADTEYEWPWYGELVGAYFNGHPNDPNVQEGMVQVVDRTHSSTKHLPEQWKRTDEFYNYRDIQPQLSILQKLDEKTYRGGTNGAEHPITWFREFDGGRMWYTGLGHTRESYSDPEFLDMLWGGIQYAAGPGKPVDYNNARVAPEENRFQKVVLDLNLDEPMELDLLPNEDILFIERKGTIRLFKKSENKTQLITKIPVFHELEDGLLGLAIDPNYKNNNWIYLYYSPVGTEAVQHLSRFVFRGDSLERASEKIILKVPTQREQCCHSAGSIEFGPDALLYLSVGDNTSPRDTGFGPMDERVGREPWDAQRTSGNTQDLRGKILRIRPEADGTYSIPEGNLFTDKAQGRPEIYVMGVRNPYRISIDAKTGFLYWGDVGPDAGKDSVGFGSKGYDEVNQARKAGNHGWPFFIGKNFAYNDYDFATKKSGPLFDPAKPVNPSPNNTGAKELPPATPPLIWYPYTPSLDFPLVGEGGRNAMAGPVFYVDQYPDSDSRFPVYYDRKFFAYDWMRGWIMAVTLDEEGNYVRMERFLPSTPFNNIIDIVMGPAGDMYALEYGTNWFSQNADARLIHIAYSAGNRRPMAEGSADHLVGRLPLTVQFNSDASKDPDGDELTYRWDFGDGEISEVPNPQHVFSKAGEYRVKLTVTDPSGQQSEKDFLVSAGNESPTINIRFKGNRSFYWDKSKLDYTVEVQDAEDGSLGKGIDARAVTFTTDYLARGKDITQVVQGHQANMEASAHLVGKALYEASDCKACHHPVDKSVGPSLTKIAEQYAGEESAIAALAGKVIKGGSGVWGSLMMSPHPQLRQDETEKMIRYILSFSSKTTFQGLPVTGSYSLNQHKPGETQGTYILTASYTDRGAAGAKPRTVTEVVALSYPRIGADTFTEKQKAMTFRVTKEIFPAIEEEITMVLPNDQGFVKYSGIDLTDVGKIKVGVAVAPNYFSGGKLELRLGDANGPIIGSGNLELGLTDIGFKELLVPIQATEGVKDLVLYVTCTDPTKIFAGLATLEFVKR